MRIIDTTKRRLHKKKARRKTDNSDKKQYRQYKHRQNENIKKTKVRRKTTLWTFQATNMQVLARENLDVAIK